MDNGPIAKSLVFQRVLDCLGVRLMTHLPQDKDGRRPTARSKGKVERPFRTVKEAHETLYHFHQPQDEAEANLWLHRYLARYNGQQHRSEAHSRAEDWLAHLPEAGVRAMCAWERFCAFAREPERRVVGNDARVSVDGVAYEVDADLAGETVLLWWGLFDRDLYVEHGDKRFGPYTPVGGPIPLHRYRARQKTRGEERADRIAALAERLGLPRAALEGNPDLVEVAAPATLASARPEPARIPFRDPDPFEEIAYPNAIRAKLAIADLLGQPLARLSEEERTWINGLLTETLSKTAVLKRLMEVIDEGGGRLSVVLAGHPKLRNDLRRPTMEEIGYRTSQFAFEGISGHQRAYIAWLLQTCAADGLKPSDLVADEAAELMAAKLRTPLQIERHLTLAFEEGFRVGGEKPLSAEVVETVLSNALDDLEPRLTRHGYSVRTLSEQFNAKPAEIRRLLRGDLDAARTRELAEEMRAAGLPL